MGHDESGRAVTSVNLRPWHVKRPRHGSSGVGSNEPKGRCDRRPFRWVYRFGANEECRCDRSERPHGARRPAGAAILNASRAPRRARLLNCRLMIACYRARRPGGSDIS
jgi:hypothetical protein